MPAFTVAALLRFAFSDSFCQAQLSSNVAETLKGIHDGAPGRAIGNVNDSKTITSRI